MRNFRLSPLSLLLVVLLLAMVVVGTVGAGMITVNATASGYMRETTDQLFLSMVRDTGDAAVMNGATSEFCGYTVGSNSQDLMTDHSRCGLTFPTGAALPDNAVITAAKLSVFYHGKHQTIGNPGGLELIDFYPGSDQTYIGGDYGNTSFNAIAPNISYASFLAGLNNFTMSNKTPISLTKNTTLMLDHSASVYLSNLSETWVTGGQYSSYEIKSVPSANRSYTPFLTLTYETPPTGAYTIENTFGNVVGKFPNGTVIASAAEGTDDTLVIQTVVSTATAGSTISFTGNFTPTGKVTINKNMSFVKAGAANFAWNTSDANGGFYAPGALSKTLDVTADVAYGATLIPVNTAAGVTPGDLLFIYDDTIWDADNYPDWKDGESHRISSIVDNNITISDPIYIGYENAKNATVLIYTPITTSFDGLNLTTTADATDAIGIYLLYNVNSTVTNCSITDFRVAGVNVRNSIDTTVTKNVMFTNVYTGYGVGVVDANSFITIRDNTFSRFSHGVSCGGTETFGISRGTLADFNTFNDTVFDSHSGVYNVTVTNNTITKTLNGANSYGMEIGAINATVYNNTVTISASSNYGGVIPRGYRGDRVWSITGNVFIDTPIGFYAKGDGAAEWAYVKYCDNTITGGGTDIVQDPAGCVHVLAQATHCSDLDGGASSRQPQIFNWYCPAGRFCLGPFILWEPAQMVMAVG